MLSSFLAWLRAVGLARGERVIQETFASGGRQLAKPFRERRFTRGDSGAVQPFELLLRGAEAGALVHFLEL